jgi:hypothetical protein
VVAAVVEEARADASSRSHERSSSNRVPHPMLKLSWDI